MEHSPLLSQVQPQGLHAKLPPASVLLTPSLTTTCEITNHDQFYFPHPASHTRSPAD